MKCEIEKFPFSSSSFFCVCLCTSYNDEIFRRREIFCSFEFLIFHFAPPWNSQRCWASWVVKFEKFPFAPSTFRINLILVHMFNSKQWRARKLLVKNRIHRRDFFEWVEEKWKTSSLLDFSFPRHFNFLFYLLQRSLYRIPQICEQSISPLRGNCRYLAKVAQYGSVTHHLSVRH